MFLRGNVVTLDGDAEAVANAATVVRELAELVEQGHEIGAGTIDAVTARARPAHLAGRDPRGRRLAPPLAHASRPKTVNQKRYVDSDPPQHGDVRHRAGRHRQDLPGRRDGRRRAVAARGQPDHPHAPRRRGRRAARLPARRPDGEDRSRTCGRCSTRCTTCSTPRRSPRTSSAGVIEVAPLAFMRGRAQPVDQPVLTPDGWRPIGVARVGDLVTGSDGRPTPVLGVFPQGQQARSSASRRRTARRRCACAEHLWFVTTPDDRKHGKPGRVVETREMIGRLRRTTSTATSCRCCRAPVEFPERDGPDRSVRARAAARRRLPHDDARRRASRPPDPELADALEDALDGIALCLKQRGRLRPAARRRRSRRRASSPTP